MRTFKECPCKYGKIGGVDGALVSLITPNYKLMPDALVYLGRTSQICAVVAYETNEQY
jgi:hypothetical protein